MRTAACLLLLLGCGCAERWERVERGPQTVSVSDLQGLFDPETRAAPLPFGTRGPAAEGRWKSVPPRHAEAAVLDVALEIDPPAPEPAAPAIEPEPSGPRLPVPRRRGAVPVESKGARDIDLIARERFITHPTLIHAERATLFCPASYRNDVQLTGGLVEPEPNGVLRATGSARLLLHELTIEADEILLRSAPADDIQILARGNVGFVTRLKKQVTREQGLRSLMIRNDRTLPLR